jgi:hypothetical protein
MLRWETGNAEFVHALSGAILEDAIVVASYTVPRFEAKLLPQRKNPPVAVVFSDALGADARNAPLRATMSFTRGLAREEVLVVEPGTTGLCLVGSADAKEVGPMIRVSPPSSAYRIGKDCPRVTKVIVQDPTSIFDPGRRVPPF